MSILLMIIKIIAFVTIMMYIYLDMAAANGHLGIIMRIIEYA